MSKPENLLHLVLLWSPGQTAQRPDPLYGLQMVGAGCDLGS